MAEKLVPGGFLGAGLFGGGGGPPPPTTSGGIFVATDRESNAGNTEVIIFEALVDLDRLGATMTPYLTGIGFISAAGGTNALRMYLGATTPGNTLGGTAVVMITTASLTPIGFNGVGAVLANAGGPSLLQITLQQPVPGLLTTTVRGYIGGLF